MGKAIAAFSFIVVNICMFLCWPDKNYVYILILDVLTSNILTALNCAIFLWQSLPGKEVDEVKNQTNGLSIMTLCLKRAFKKASLKSWEKKFATKFFLSTTLTEISLGT